MTCQVDDVAASTVTLTAALFPFSMLHTRLLRSARPLSRLISHQLASPLRSSLTSIRLVPRFYSDSATDVSPRNARRLPQNTSDSAEAKPPDEPKYSLTFTCKVPECDERTSHVFSKRAYHHGIVIIQCPKCENRYVVFVKSTPKGSKRRSDSWLVI